MSRLRILGRQADADQVLDRLQQLALVHLAETPASNAVTEFGGAAARAQRREQLRLLAARIDALRGAQAGDRPVGDAPRLRSLAVPLPLAQLQTEVGELTDRVDALDKRLDALREERLLLPDYLVPLEQLLPLVPDLAGLDAGEFGSLGLSTAALVLNTADDQLVEALKQELERPLGRRFELVWTRAEDAAVACLLVYPRAEHDVVQALLGRAQVRNVALPGQLQQMSLHAAVRHMRERLAQIPAAEAALQAQRHDMLAPHARRLVAISAGVAVELERLAAVDRLGATRRAFLATCWIPRNQVSHLRAGLRALPGGAVVVEELPSSARDVAPVLMRNLRVARPFEPLVRFLDIPHSSSIDPTLLMSLVLPVMFGAMVGDIGYGLALFVPALLLRRRRPAAGSELTGLTWLLLAGAVWSVVFGVLFGEFFGDLGQRMVGDFAVWQYRGQADALQPLLLFAVVAGLAHVVLGLLLGAWQAARSGETRVLLDKLGMLLALGGLCGIAVRVADRLPATAVIPSAAAVIAGTALISSLHGMLGVVTGPLDLLGRIGNVLSYLRLAAVGLASAYLAGVANELGGIGPIWMGVLVAAIFHLLNLALAAFSPTIQALRLHYVEFFGTFFIGGGLAFTPFGRELRQATATT